MKNKLGSYSPMLNVCLVGMAGIVSLKETPAFSLLDLLQNPDIPEIRNESKLIWPCVITVSGVQQSVSLEQDGSVFFANQNHLRGDLSLAIKTNKKI